MTITNNTLDAIIMCVLSVSVFGPESVSYERSRLGNRTNLRHCSARVFFVKMSQSHDFSISKFPGYQNGSFSSISRFPGNQNGSFSNISRIPGFQSDSNQIKNNTRHLKPLNKKYDDKINRGVRVVCFNLVGPV